MSGHAADKAASMEEISLLLFEAGGVRMAVEASQVRGTLGHEEAVKSGLPLVRLDKALSLPMGQSAQSKALIIEGKKPYAILVDRLDELAAVGMDSLRPIPPLAASGSEAVWGACIRGDDFLLLVDFQRLAGPLLDKEKRISAE